MSLDRQDKELKQVMWSGPLQVSASPKVVWPPTVRVRVQKQ